MATVRLRGVGKSFGVAEGLAREGVHLLLAGRRADVLAAEARRLSRDYSVTAVPVAGDDIATVAGVEGLVEDWSRRRAKISAVPIS